MNTQSYNIVRVIFLDGDRIGKEEEIIFKHKPLGEIEAANAVTAMMKWRVTYESDWLSIKAFEMFPPHDIAMMVTKNNRDPHRILFAYIDFAAYETFIKSEESAIGGVTGVRRIPFQ